jgi:hypothetical protein
MAWYIQCLSKTQSLSVIFHFILISDEEARVCFAKFFQEIIHLGYVEVSCCIRVKSTPNFYKSVNIVLFNRKTECNCLTNESVHNYSNEKVKEYLSYNDLKGHKIEYSYSKTSTSISLSTISSHRLRIFIRVTLESNTTLSSSVKHDRVPTFSSSTAE